MPLRADWWLIGNLVLIFAVGTGGALAPAAWRVARSFFERGRLRRRRQASPRGRLSRLMTDQKAVVEALRVFRRNFDSAAVVMATSTRLGCSITVGHEPEDDDGGGEPAHNDDGVEQPSSGASSGRVVAIRRFPGGGVVH